MKLRGRVKTFVFSFFKKEKVVILVITIQTPTKTTLPYLETQKEMVDLLRYLSIQVI